MSGWAEFRTSVASRLASLLIVIFNTTFLLKKVDTKLFDYINT